MSEFQADLRRVEQLLRLIQDFRAFAASVEPNGTTATWKDAQRLRRTGQDVRTDLPVLAGSLLLYLCGRFENFVRELVGTVVDDLVDGASVYADLPEELRREYVARTLAIVQSPASYNHNPATAAALAAELASNISGTGPSVRLRVSASVLTITESNMNPGTVADVFKRVGVGDLWNNLGKQAPLKTYLSESKDADCTRAARSRLDEVMNERNRVAHPTKDTAFPDAEYVEEVVRFFHVLARVLVDLALVPR